MVWALVPVTSRRRLTSPFARVIFYPVPYHTHGYGVTHDHYQQESRAPACSGGYSNGGTGEGISANFSTDVAASIQNNFVEGFSGTGGNGIEIGSASSVSVYGHNKFYNNATDEDLSGDIILNLGNNDVLDSSPLTDPGSDDFTADTLLKALSYPSSFKGASTGQFLDVGAAQREEPAGGGVLTHPGMVGGVSG